MGFLGALAGGLLGIGGSAIESNAAKHAAAQAADQQAQLEQQAYQQQLAYIAQQEAMQRQALQGFAAMGNPYFQAAQTMPKPTFAAGGSFGPGAPQQTPSPPANGFAGMSAPPQQASPMQFPAPQASAGGFRSALPGTMRLMLPPGQAQQPHQGGMGFRGLTQ